MSKIVKEQIRLIINKLADANRTVDAEEYGKTVQLLNEAGVMILAVAVNIQKLLAGE